jgi:hypothetical protein
MAASPENDFCGKCGERLGREDNGKAPASLAAPALAAEVTVSKRSIPRMAKALTAIIVIAALVGLGYKLGPGAARPSPTPTPITQTVIGEIVVSDYTPMAGGVCYSASGYSDIAVGVPVILRDENNTILASSTLDAGHLATLGCTFGFTLTNVPNTAKFYAAEVSHRGQVSYSHQEMVDKGWRLQLSLG